MEVFAKRLKSLRNDAGEKQTELQAILHVSQGMVSSFENGREPSFDTLIQIAQHYHVTTDYLLGLSSSKGTDSSVLMASINDCATAAESIGIMPAGADELHAMYAQLTAYLHGPQQAGDAPLRTINQLCSGMTDLLSALNRDSAASVIDANNALMSTVLQISQITTAFLNNRNARTQQSTPSP